MSKGAIIAVVGIVVLVAGAFLTVTFMNQGGTQENVTQGTPQTQTNTGNFTGSIAEAIGLGQNVMCSFSSQEDGAVTSGTVYISGDNFRGDVEYSSEDGPMGVSIISDSEYAYMWGDQYPQGIKLEVSGENTDPFSFEAEDFDSPIDENASYNCSAWVIDSSMFTPPSDIEFADTSALIQDALEDAGVNADCSICDSVPDSARAQCLASFDCSQ